MKKKIVLVLILVLTLLFCACEKGETGEMGVNLLENSGFEAETGTEVSAWRLDRYDTQPPVEYYQVVQDATAPEGNNVIKIESTTFNDARFIQEVQVEPDSYYCLTAMVKTELIEQRSADSGANIGFLQSYCKSQYIKSNTDWKKVTVYGKTDEDTEKVVVALRLGDYSADASGTVYFDDVSLTRVESVPEGYSVSSMGSFQFASSDSSDEKEDKKAEPDDVIASVTIVGVVLFALLVIFLVNAYKNLNLGMREGLIIIGISVVIRLIGSVLYKGFLVDIGCFASWGEIMAANGITGFYSETSFCDYPPLYMIVLGIITSITQPLGMNLREGFGLLVLKLPAVICDTLAAIMIIKIAKKHLSEKLAVILGVGYALLPTAVVNSAIWGQVDSILVLFMLITFYLIDEDKFGLSVLTFTIGLLFKPQAILFGPVMLLAAINEFYNIYVDFRNNNKGSGKARLLKGFGFLGASVLLFVLLSVIMRNDQSKVVLDNGMEVDWLIGKYLSTLGSYDYATLSSFGLMGLLDGQWVASETEVFAGISYGTLGTVLLWMVGILVVGIFVYLIRTSFKSLNSKKAYTPVDRGWFWLLCALMLAGAVTVSTRTHERYIFPVIAMLIMAFVRFKDIRLLFISLGYSLLNFINVAGLLFLYEEAGVYFQNMDKPTLNETVFKVGSALTVVLFIYQVFVTIRIMLGKKTEIKDERAIEQKTSAKTPVKQVSVSGKKTDELNKLLSRRSYSLPKVTKKDILICLLITAVYACVAFTNLGDVKAAQTFWYADKSEVYALADLGEEKTFDTIKIKVNSSVGSFKIMTSSDGESFSLYQNISIAERHEDWITVGTGGSARYIKLEAVTGINISELVILKDEKPLEVVATSEKVVPVDNISGKASKLFDEQDGYITDSVKNVPMTSWTTGGNHIITFEKPVSVFGLKAYFKSAGNLTVAVPSDVLGEQAQEVPWTDAITVKRNDEGWADGALQISDELLGGVDKVLVKCEIPYNINELFFISGDEIKIRSITDMEGQEIPADSDFYNCFDEADKAKNHTVAGGNAWSISTVADYVIADFGEATPIDRGYYRTSLSEGKFTMYFSDDGVLWSQQNNFTVEKSNLYYWHNATASGKTRYVLITADSQFLKLIEVGFFEEPQSTETIKIKEITASNTSETGGKNLFDEQELVPSEGATYMNSMYFDEIYHARTAYESANGHSIYEWTHPPLGKDIMSWCVSLMGMTPFAWRFAGTVVGVLMVPAIYFLALLLFRKTSWATAAAILMAFDGMHYVQTRIATIDSFGVFFIILMFLFMFWYYSLSFYNTPLKKTFVPLGLCGLSFGLGAASKWICLYAGAGLAVIFFITIFRRWSEYSVAKKNLKKATGEEKRYLTHICETFIPNTMYTLLFCIGVFIVVPIIIYSASYYPYWNAEGETRKWYEIILSNQEAMFSYHSKLEATHPYQSDWYTWPVMETPMFYYAGPQDADNMSAIYAFGNPAVWYSGLVCTIAAIVVFFKRMFNEKLSVKSMNATGFFGLFKAGDEDAFDMTERDTRTLMFLIIGIACNLLPWVGIERCIFIYHYFASVPFIILFTVYILRHFARKHIESSSTVTIVLLVITVVLFFMFRPVWTGTSVSRDYVGTWLRWLPTWFGYYFPKG